MSLNDINPHNLDTSNPLNSSSLEELADPLFHKHPPSVLPSYGLDTLVFVDSSVQNYGQILSNLDSSVGVVVLESDRNGVEQIGEILNNYTNINTIHIFSHGDAGSTQLGNTNLNTGNLESYYDQLMGWGNALTEQGDILFYGCNIADGTLGESFVNQIAQLTGTDVAASNDLTGAGGDWVLEFQSGAIESSNPFDTVVLEKYDFALAMGVIEIFGSSNNDNLVIAQDLTDSNLLHISGNNFTIKKDDREIIGNTFAKDATSITIFLDEGDDTLTFNDLGHGVTANITVAGSDITSGIPILGDFIDDLLLGDDTVIFAGNTLLGGGNLTVDAETITVNSGVTISTRKIESGVNISSSSSTGNSGRISFTGQDINLKSGSKLLAQVQDKSTFLAGAIKLDVDAYSIVRLDDNPSPGSSINLSSAEIRGGLIELNAAASERFGVFGFKKDAIAEIAVDSSTIVGTSVIIDANADTTLVPPLEIEMSDSGNMTLELKDNGASPATIKRTGGSGNWLLDGFISRLGTFIPTITIVDSQNNDNIYKVASISGDTITLEDGEEFTENETTFGVIRVFGTSVLPGTEAIANTFLTSLFPFGGSAFVSIANTTATTQIKGNSKITATTGSVEIKANADGRATPLGPALGIKKIFNVAAAYAESTATAIASVEGNTTITASNQVQVLSTTSNLVTATSTATAKNTPVNLTFAGAITTSETKAFTGADTTITAKGINVSSESGIDVAVASSVSNAGQSGASITVGLNLVDTITEAHIDGTAITTDSTGTIQVTATAETDGNLTVTDAANLGNTQNLGFTQQLSQQFNSFFKDSGKKALESAGVKGVAGFIGEKVLGKLFPTLKSGKLNLGGAITIADTEQVVKAYIAENAQITAAGTVEVTASLSDSMNVSATANTTSDGASIGGAVIVGDYSNDVHAYIGESATVTAEGDITVDAQIEIPFPWESSLNTLAELLAFDFDSVDEVISFLKAAYFDEGTPGIDTIFTSFVKNGSAGSKFGLAGAVELMNFTNTARAEIADNANVTSKTGNIEVFGRTEMNVMNLVGGSSKFSYSFVDKFLLGRFASPINSAAQKAGVNEKYKLNEPSQPKSGIGGAFTLYNIDNSAIATIGDGAEVKATTGSIVVTSDTEERSITVTSSNGKSEKLGVFGAASLINLNTTSQAFIEDTAKITAQEDLVIRSTSDPRVYNFTLGGVNIFKPLDPISGGGTVGIGASVGLTTVENVTKAFIGNEKELSGNPTLTFNDVALTGNPSLDFQDVSLQGNPSLTFIPVVFTGDLTFTKNDNAPDTITRSGNWNTDNFVEGQIITISGTDDNDGDNDGSYEIASIDGNIITLADDSELAISGSSSNVEVVGSDMIQRSAGDWSNDGFEVGQIITISGTEDNENDGNYEIAAINGDLLTLVEGNVFTSKTGENRVSIQSSDTISRNAGSWLDDGFLPGQTLTISGSNSNNGTFTIDEVTDNKITLRRNLPDEDNLNTIVDESSLDQTLTTEKSATGVTITGPDTITRSDGSWLADGFRPGDEIIVSSSNNNNGTYTLATIDGNIAILESSDQLQDEVAEGVKIDGDAISGTGSITAKDVTIDALGGDQIVSFSIAGTKTSGKKDTGKGKSDAGSGSVPNNAEGGTFGFGASGDVSINNVENNTRAYVDGQVLITTTGKIDLFAANTGTPQMTGSPELIFADAGTNDTITRNEGSWIGDGFRAGQTLRVKDTNSNDGYYRILSVEDIIITLETGDNLTSQTTSEATITTGPAMSGTPELTFSKELNDVDTIERDGGSWVAEGFRPGQIINISGTTLNNGEFKVVSVTASTLSIAIVTLSDLSLSHVLKNETIASGSDVRILAADDGLAGSILAGSGSVVLQGNKKSAGLAGSYSQNTISGGVQAFVSQATLNADGDINISARTPGSISSYAASGNKVGKLGIAGQVTNNEVSRHTKSFLEGATILNVSDVRVSGIDTASIFSVSGVATLGGEVGIGASVSINQINSGVKSYIDNADLTVKGDVKVDAISKPTVDVLALGGAISGAASEKSASTIALGGAFTFNDIATTVEASIKGNSKVTTLNTGSVILTASDESQITAEAIGFSGALTFADGNNGGGLAIGAAIARNQINNNLQAYILDSTVESDGDLQLSSINKAKIIAEATAVAVALTAANQTGISLSGGGAESTNVIIPKINAYIEGSMITSGGDVDIQAMDTSSINADVLAAAITATLGLKNAGGVAIGASFSTNLIGWEASFGEALGPVANKNNDAAKAEVQAYIKNSKVEATRDLYLTALANGTIEAGVDAVAVGLAGGAGNAGQLSGAGVRTENRIRNQIKSFIDGTVPNGKSDQGIITADSANLIANDTSKITANALSAAVAASFGADNALGGTIGVSLALNEVLNEVEAYIKKETVTVERAVVDQANYKEKILPGVTIVASGDKRYQFLGRKDGDLLLPDKVDLSAENYGDIIRWEDVTDKTTEFDVTYQKTASEATKKGRIKIEAKEDATISATVTAASIAVAGSGKISIALSGGGAEAVNIIGTNTNAYIIDSTVTSEGEVTLDARNTSLIDADVLAVSGSVGIGGKGGVAAAIGASIAHNFIGFDLIGFNADGTVQIGNDASPNKAQIQAYVEDSTVKATTGDIRQTAISHQTITAEVWAGSVAISGGSQGALSLSGAGVSTVNKIATQVKTYIDGAVGSRIEASNILLTAQDTSKITAKSGAAALAVAIAPKSPGVSVAIGVALAENTIANTVESYITNSPTVIASDQLSLTAKEAATVEATTIAASLGVAISALGVGLTGAGANATNIINNKVHAYIDNSNSVIAQNNILIDAQSEATITSLVGAASVAGGTVGAGAIGVSLARNLIGLDGIGDTSPLGNEVLAYVKNSTLTSDQGNITVQAKATDKVDAVSFAGSVAIAGGILAAAGAGAEVINQLSTKVEAYSENSNITATVGDISVTALSNSEIVKAQAIGVAVAVNLNISSGVAISVGVSKVDNDIKNQVQAYVIGTTDKQVKAEGNISINADAEQAKITDSSAFTASVSGGAFGLSGGGVDIDNVISNTVKAWISGSLKVNATQNVEVIANENANAIAESIGISASFSIGAAVGASIVENTISSNIEASIINGATVDSVDTTVKAISVANIEKTYSLVVAGSAVGVASNDASATVNTTVSAFVKDSTLNATGNVLVEAHSTSTANSEGNGVAVGAVGVGVVNSYSYDFGSTTAYIENSNITQADNLDVLATAIETLDSTLTSASGGVLGGVQVNKSESISRHNATAYIGTNSKIDVDNTLNVIAKIQPQVKANADGYSVAGGIAVGSSTAIAETDSDVNAYINIGNRNSTYQVKAANLNVEAKQELPTTGFSVEADAMGSGGGLLASVNGSEATAKNSNNFSAYIGDNTNLNITNVATITVQDISHQDAYATGVSVSGLSAGFHLAKAETNTTHNSYLGTNVIFRGGTLNVTAFGNTTNFAESVAGGGGIISGQAADARTINNNNATVTINNGQDNNHINVTNLNLKAQQISDFNAKTNAINASIAGGSGADSNNIVTTNVLVDIKDVHIIADNIVARSHNIMNKSALADQNAEAGSGGVFDASAVKSITRVRNTSKVTVADNATLEVVGDLDNPGDFVLNAHNKITARDEVNIDVGGGIPFAGGDSIIGITLNQAIVEIGNADLKSVGDIDLWTRSDVDIATDVQAKTYGLAGLPSGTSITEFTGAVNQVLIKDGAFIYAKRDVNIDAGRGYDEAKRRNYSTVNLFSNIYLLNGSAGANPDPVTRLTVNSSNLVTIEKNATIQSVRDVAIEASKGFTNVSGKGEGKSLWKEIASWFGGSDTIIGNPKISETYNEYVTINGSVTAGFDNKQRVRLDQINATSARVYLNGEDKGIINSSGLKIAYDDNSSFEILDVNFASDIINRIKTIESILATYTTAETNTGGTVTTQDGEAEASTNYRGSTFTAAEKQNYEDELAGLEFLQNSLGLSLNDPAQTFISLPNIVVSSGDIIINTQNLSGSGDLTAQGDSLIEVENNSNINLLINTLIIRDGNGGKLLLNGQSKTSNGEILAANSSKSGVNFTNISTSEGETTEISVINKSVNGPLMLSNDDGIVSNLDGIVSLVNDKGSIGIQGELAAKTINIQAGEDFILTDGYFFHTGGNPESVDSTLVGKYESLANPLNTATTTAKDRIPSLNPYFQINSQGYNGRVSPNYSYGFDPSPATTSTKNLSHTWETATTNPSAIVAENNIFISANYINVNGLIQSGVDSYNLILESSLNDDIEKEDNKWGVDAIDNDYRYTLKDGMTTNGKVTSGTIGAIKAVFNPFTNLIEVEDIDVRGGYVELRGKVLSTGTGRIQAMDGFGNINITNYTDYGLELGNLNAGGEGIEGQIVIIDRLKNTESRYTYSDAGNLLNNNAVVSSGRSTLYTPSSATYKYVSYGNEYTYDYNEAYTSNAFTWRTGLPTTPSMKYTYTVGLKIVGEDDSNRTGDKDYSYILENSNLGSDYEFDATANVNSISYVSWYYPNGYKNDQPNLLRDVVVTDFAIQEYFTHSFKANHPIDIRFVGNNTGAIKVTSNQSIYLNGSITNVAGTTTLNSKFGSILMPSDSIIDTKNIVLSAETGIGELDQALATGIRGGTINATTTSGNIDINDEGSGLKVQEIQASNGDVTLITKNDVTALNGNSLIAGNLVTLNSASGTIGTASSAIQVDTKGDTSHGLDAQANNGIYLTEKTGDLFLIQATSQNGDVSIRATNGSIVDNNTGGEEDLIAKDEVLAAINQKLRLTVENGALESIKETKEAYKNSKQQDYQRYWEYRNIQDNRNISYVDDNTATVLNDFGKLVPVNSNGINFSLTDFTNYFGDVDGDALASITIKSLPSSGLLQLNGVEVGQNTVIDASDLGNLVYIPGEDFTGDVEFEVLADDGSGNTDLGSITLRVGESNTAPIFSDISVDGLVNKKVEFEAIHFLSGFSDGDGDRLAGITVNRLSAVTINALPTNGTLMLNGQAVVAGQRIVQFSNLEFIPSNGFTGIASFGVTVEDEFGATALGQVNVNIKAAFTADAYDPNFQYQFDQSRKDNLSAMGYSEAKIQGLEQQKTQDYHALHGQLEAPGLTAAYDPNYKYEFSSNAEENSLEEGGVWTKEQLKYGLSSAIFLDVSDTELVIEDPNAKGHNITLRASVNIGSDNGTRSFLIADITKGTPQEEEFLLAIATAERSDITYYADVAGTIVITGNVLEYNDVPARIDIRIREDVDIEATGVITASSNGVMFLGSEENMNLNTLNSNNNDVRIKSAKGIYNGVGGSTVNVIAGNEVILEAGDNDIGTKDSDVRIQVGGNNVFTARSGNNIYLTQVNNDIKLDNLFAVGHIRLKAEVGSILDRFETETRNIRSASLELIAAQSIGTANNFFDIIVDGQVDATANDGIYLRSLSNLTIGTVTSNNSDVRVQLDAAAQNIDILNSINAAGNVTLEGENTLSLGANGEINAGVNVFILARDITLGTVKAASGEVFIEAKDSLELAADSNIFANGNITMKIDSDPLDDPGVGGTTNIYGNVTSNGIVEIEGGVDDDIFTFNGIITAGAATISSFEGEDEFYFQGINTPLTVYAGSGDDYAEINAPDSANGILIFNAGAGNDTIDASQAALALVLNGEDDDDTITGGMGDDLIGGGDGDDTIDGKEGADKIFGDSTFEKSLGNSFTATNTGSGEDNLQGGDGADLIKGEGENDRIFGGDGNDDIAGGLGDDTLGGDAGNDLIKGEEGNDIISGGDDDDVLEGGLGDDTLRGDAGNDLIKGEEGNDTVTYDNSPNSVVVNLDRNQGFANLGGFLHESVFLHHQFVESDLEPTFAINAGEGQDGFGGIDTLIDLENAIGSDYADVLIGDDGDNKLFGLKGNDVFISNVGNDSLEGNEGRDAISYRRDPNAVIVDLSSPTATDGFGDTDSLTNIEDLIGTAFDDTLTGDSGANRIYGGDGQDIISGGDGNDELYGENDNDELYGDSGDDFLVGGLGVGNTITDQIDGGEGIDTVSYYTSTTRVSANLGNGTGTEGDALGDRFTSVENLEGSEYNDTLRGDDGANILSGLGGDDKLYGLDGDNSIYGGDGNDFMHSTGGNTIMDGGSGINTFTVTGNGNSIIYGGEGNDNINTGAGDDVIYGGEGINVINAGEGNNTIYGGSGKDTITSGSGNDTIYGGEGDNVIRAGEGNNTVTTGSGNDNITSGAGDDIIDGGDGNNFINAGTGNNTVTTGAGNDNITSSTGDDIINAGDGDNFINAGDGLNQITGGTGKDTIHTGTGDDIIDGGDGDNFINAGTGNNTVTTGSGKDTITTGSGDDIINAGNGDNFINAGDGLNQITTGAGNDNITTGSGDDIINAGNGKNYIYAGNGDNDITTGTGDDRITSGTGNDVIVAGDGYNFINAGDGDNDITGGDGIDYIIAGAGNDIIRAGEGNNIIRAGEGNNTITAGSGRDNIIAGSGNDTIDGGDGDNTINAGNGNNEVTTGSGNDRITTGSGDDFIYYGDGIDLVNAGTGINDTKKFK